MLRKIIIRLAVIIFLSPIACADESYSNFKKYSLTETTFKLEKIAQDLKFPWALTFLDKNNLLVTEKNGGLFKINIENGEKEKIKHNIQHIPYLGGHQGGLLDTYFDSNDNFIYFTYSHKFNEDSNLSSTAIARGNLTNGEITNLQVLLIAKPPLPSKKHFGSRISIKGDTLFASFGERDEGMIAQDPSTHPGSIIRIKTDGSIPKDNPKFTGKDSWLPEIYTIGVRNPQGITISPYNKKIIFSNHGPRGGDHIGEVEAGANYGWKDVAWGGTEYSFLRIGDKAFKEKYKKPLKTWVPSMAISSIQFYQGNTFPEWQGDLIISSLGGQSLIRLDFVDNQILGEEIIFKNKIGRIRDFEINKEGDIFLISDSPQSSLWKLTKNK
jgi:glucose/arabinose dehydrogenase